MAATELWWCLPRRWCFACFVKAFFHGDHMWSWCFRKGSDDETLNDYLINHQQILKYPILVYIQTNQRIWNLGKHEVEPFHGMEHNFLSSRRSRRNSKRVARSTNPIPRMLRFSIHQPRRSPIHPTKGGDDLCISICKRWGPFMNIPKNQNSRQRYGDGSKPMGNNGITIF